MQWNKAKQHRGFTLLELLVVIAIIGVLSAVIMVSINDSRRKARNAAVIEQMYEYQKAIELNYSNTGEYPHPNSGNNRRRVHCIGDGLTGADDCMDTISFGGGYNAGASGVIETQFKHFMSSLPRFKQNPWSSPAYNGCSNHSADVAKRMPALDAAWGSCTPQDYSIFYVLEGVNQDCGGRATLTNSNISGVYTFCRLQNTK